LELDPPDLDFFGWRLSIPESSQFRPDAIQPGLYVIAAGLFGEFLEILKCSLSRKRRVKEVVVVGLWPLAALLPFVDVIKQAYESRLRVLGPIAAPWLLFR
jgi:hypothetical protein